MMLDTVAVRKLQDRVVQENKTKLASFIGLANHYFEIIQIYVTKVHRMLIFLTKHVTF